MGCCSSKETAVDPAAGLEEPESPIKNDEQTMVRTRSDGSQSKQSRGMEPPSPPGPKLSGSSDHSEKLYKLLAKVQMATDANTRSTIIEKAISCCDKDPDVAHYQNPNTLSTPLHMAVRMLDSDTMMGRDSKSLAYLIQVIIAANPASVVIEDAGGHIPLHYAVAPTTFNNAEAQQSLSHWTYRAKIVQILVSANGKGCAEYLSRNNVVFESRDATGGCSPLYRVIQTLPDDFEPKGPTYQYVGLITEVCPTMAGVGNKSDQDKPLALLYRRFTRQFDISEKFFAGDNSRPEVLEHRKKYKTAAGNTWKIIELLLRPPSPQQKNSAAKNWRIVHRAVQVETPPDLLRYIVETNPEDLTQADENGNTPLHYAALSTPPNRTGDTGSFPSFYTKYVVDELLYKFPEGAKVTNGDNKYPLTLAVNSGKQWIGGGIKSLFDAYPDAMKQIDLSTHPSLQRVFSMVEGDDADKNSDTVIKDEHHDAIMLVQQDGVSISEVTTSMWAHEEDAGVQMLGCVAISKMTRTCTDEDILQISLNAVGAVVNAMKAHPNEVIVQEKAANALRLLAPADGNREVSLVASGAVAAIVGAMQAHVGDPNVQEEAAGAVAAIVHHGGADRATIVGSVSGVTAIINAVAAHPDSEGVQRNGCWALKEMTEYPDANLPDLPRSQTAPLLEAARNAFPESCGEFAEVVLSRMM